MGKKIYNIALIGCGTMGAAHLDDIYAKEDINLSYVCDTDLERAATFKRLYNADNITCDYNDIINDDNVDIVIISTYPSSHLEILKKCIAKKKHVLCEKPITDSLKSGEEFVSMVKANPDVKVLVGHILRHNKTYQKVAEMIQSGALGFPIVMRMAQNHHTMDWQKYKNLICNTSPVIDCGVHYIDVMRWFTGAEITDVSAVGLKTEPDLPDTAYNYGLLTAKLSDGSLAYYEVGWSNTISANNLKEFFGPNGRIRITYQEARSEHQEEGDLIEYYKYPEKKYEIINLLSKRKPTGAQLDALIDMIENGSVGSPTIDDVWESFKIALSADKMIKDSLKK